MNLNRSKLSPKIVAILDKFKQDKTAYGTLKEGYLKLAAHKVLQDSLKHDTFCDYFKAPRKLPPILLKLYGITDRELKHEMEQFHLKDYKVYSDPYYLTLLIAYLIGIDNDDAELRQYALALISILIWNYYKLVYFPKVCDAEIARYVLNYEMRNNHTFKNKATPLNYIMQVTIPQVDAKYPAEIAKDPVDQYSGLKRIITTIRSRFNQLMSGISKLYYKAYEEGKREGVGNLYKNSHHDSHDQVERNEHFSGMVERVADKILKVSTLKKKVIQSNPIKDLLYKKFYISNIVLAKIDDYIENHLESEDLKYMIELLFAGMKFSKEDQLCSLDINIISNNITGAKKSPELIKLKELIYGISDTIFEQKSGQMSSTAEYRQRKITMMAFIAYIKLLHCKRI